MGGSISLVCPALLKHQACATRMRPLGSPQAKEEEEEEDEDEEEEEKQPGRARSVKNRSTRIFGGTT